MINLNDYKTIPMIEFITTYFPNDELPDNIGKINHDNISSCNLHGVKRIPYTDVTKDALMRGDVILVKSYDKKHGPIIGAYQRPEIAIANENKESTQSETPNLDDLLNQFYRKNASSAMCQMTMAGTVPGEDAWEDVVETKKSSGPVRKRTMGHSEHKLGHSRSIPKRKW